MQSRPRSLRTLLFLEDIAEDRYVGPREIRGCGPIVGTVLVFGSSLSFSARSSRPSLASITGAVVGGEGSRLSKASPTTGRGFAGGSPGSDLTIERYGQDFLVTTDSAPLAQAQARLLLMSSGHLNTSKASDSA